MAGRPALSDGTAPSLACAAARTARGTACCARRRRCGQSRRRCGPSRHLIAPESAGSYRVLQGALGHCRALQHAHIAFCPTSRASSSSRCLRLRSAAARRACALQPLRAQLCLVGYDSLPARLAARATRCCCLLLLVAMPQPRSPAATIAPPLAHARACRVANASLRRAAATCQRVTHRLLLGR